MAGRQDTVGRYLAGRQDQREGIWREGVSREDSLAGRKIRTSVDSPEILFSFFAPLQKRQKDCGRKHGEDGRDKNSLNVLLIST